MVTAIRKSANNYKFRKKPSSRLDMTRTFEEGDMWMQVLLGQLAVEVIPETIKEVPSVTEFEKFHIESDLARWNFEIINEKILTE